MMITWINQKTPLSVKYDDVYFHPENGISETRSVYLQGSGFEPAIESRSLTRVGELGFGTGFNFSIAKKIFLEKSPSTAKFEFYSFEKHPWNRAQLTDFYCRWKAEKENKDWIDFWETGSNLFEWCSLDARIRLTVFFGDAYDRMDSLSKKMDFWFFDGFAPRKNPDLWTEDLFKKVARHSNLGARFSTYTSASAVRKALFSAGFEVKKVKGYFRKRERLEGVYTKEWMKIPFSFSHAIPKWKEKKAIVLGAGIAGCSIAFQLSKRGYRVSVLDKEPEIASGTSGLPAALCTPMVRDSNDPLSRFSYQAFLELKKEMKCFDPNGETVFSKGVLDWSRDQKHWEKMKNILNQEHPFGDHAEWIETDFHKKECAYYPYGMSIDPRMFCKKLLESKEGMIEFQGLQDIQKIEKIRSHWTVSSKTRSWESEILVLANSFQISKLIKELPLRYLGGRIILAKGQILAPLPEMCLSQRGFIIPLVSKDRVQMGSTHTQIKKHSEIESYLESENSSDLSKILKTISIDFGLTFSKDQIKEVQSGVRMSAKDHFPIIGPVLDTADFESKYQDYHHGIAGKNESKPKYHEGLFLYTALGSRGLNFSLMGSRLLVEMITNQSHSEDSEWIERCLMNRFWLRKMKRPPHLRNQA